MTVRKAIQFSVRLPDEPGVLAQVTEVLAGQGVNLVALAGWTEGSDAVIACVPEDPDKLRNVDAGGLTVQEREVVVVEGDDRLGVGNLLAQKIAQAGVSIHACTIQAAAGKYQAVFNVAPNDVDKIVNALATAEGCGCKCAG